MRWFELPLFAVGAVIGLAMGLLVLAFSLAVLVVHCLTFVLDDVGYRIRRDLTLPVLEEISKLCAELRDHARKKSGL